MSSVTFGKGFAECIAASGSGKIFGFLVVVVVERAHEEGHEEEHKDRPPRLAGTGSGGHVGGRAPRLHVRHRNGRRLLAAGIPWYGIPLACIYIFIASVSLSYVR